MTLALTAALVLAACATASDPESTPSASPDATPSAPSTASAPVSSSAAPETAAIDTADWQTITTPRGDATFRIPADWSTRDESMETEGGFAGATFAMGLIDSERSDPSCLPYLLFSSPDATPGLLSFGSHAVQVGPESGRGVWEVATMDDARAYVETDEYQVLRAILLSVAFPAS